MDGILFVVIETCERGTMILEFKRVTHVFGDEPDFTVVTLEDTNDSKEFMGELCRVEEEGQTMPPLPFTYSNSASILKNWASS